MLLAERYMKDREIPDRNSLKNYVLAYLSFFPDGHQWIDVEKPWFFLPDFCYFYPEMSEQIANDFISAARAYAKTSPLVLKDLGFCKREVLWELERKSLLKKDYPWAFCFKTMFRASVYCLVPYGFLGNLPPSTKGPFQTYDSPQLFLEAGHTALHRIFHLDRYILASPTFMDFSIWATFRSTDRQERRKSLIQSFARDFVSFFRKNYAMRLFSKEALGSFFTRDDWAGLGKDFPPLQEIAERENEDRFDDLSPLFVEAIERSFAEATVDILEILFHDVAKNLNRDKEIFAAVKKALTEFPTKKYPVPLDYKSKKAAILPNEIRTLESPTPLDVALTAAIRAAITLVNPYQANKFWLRMDACMMLLRAGTTDNSLPHAPSYVLFHVIEDLQKAKVLPPLDPRQGFEIPQRT